MDRFFPFPYVFDGVRIDGAFVAWPEPCVNCQDRQCEKSESVDVTTCSYGVNYVWLDDRLLIAGVLIQDLPQKTSAQIKKERKYKSARIRKSDLERVIDLYREVEHREKNLLEQEREKVIAEYRESWQYEADFLHRFREQILQGLSFLHDYRQINRQLTQNINVILETKYRDGSEDSKANGNAMEPLLEQASQEERALYWASKLLEEKIETARFLLRPEFVNDKAECTAFRFHGAVTKYMRIYAMQFEQKQVRLHSHGQSYKEIVANPKAVGVIPHTLLDNALKYAPRESATKVHFKEEETGLWFSVESIGPEILDDEKQEIFGPFFRGERAREMVEEGAGYGLYLAQYVARNHLNTEVAVSQELEDIGKGLYRTIFEVFIPASAPICESA